MLVAELHKTGVGSDAAIGNVSGKIKEGLIAAGLIVPVGNADAGRATTARSGFMHAPISIKRNESDILDRLVPAGEENIENRQRPTQVLLLQIDFHVLGDE